MADTTAAVAVKVVGVKDSDEWEFQAEDSCSEDGIGGSVRI